MIFQADEELLERLRATARERSVSVAQVIRDALERELQPPRARPRIDFIGTMDTGDTDLSRRASEGEYVPPPWRS